ncbi:mRNA transport regulator MTR2 [Wickerhamomyces ciferrii]|uniref:mRNA transport regulator MTR2 n=1 Tax=Wickerhamomyces ciferrii (strain ATCC 14091 / BCRC 22168 / CBS 111 / JCM 3599 / NBRC 0793 / NRRL Y-1031 F-60-10) TaxID=1206466 RepID=K0KWA3_WICCF|nr:mRNA transport regulator MTR2 [Wickerhamomyces ciferrii]CCH45759.1 mRNA transport regulator MTR2 [Wickerhamomyces ciferrii]
MVDQGYVKELFQTLDKQFTPAQYNLDTYKQSFLPQLKINSPVILNGNPIGGKLAFQEHWLKFPQSQHNVTSLDYHSIPGTGTLIINLSGKVRFDETGKTKLGETADLDQPQAPLDTRNFWGSWLGFNANLILDEIALQNPNSEVINSLNWRIVFKPDDSLVTI